MAREQRGGREGLVPTVPSWLGARLFRKAPRGCEQQWQGCAGKPANVLWEKLEAARLLRPLTARGWAAFPGPPAVLWLRPKTNAGSTATARLLTYCLANATQSLRFSSPLKFSRIWVAPLESLPCNNVSFLPGRNVARTIVAFPKSVPV